ncbi:Maf-like protein [Clostridium grantii]|uniref:dTTP/UTP pyrophosphatase n=1 Tax=Clostridium grantii DSM 8605 TaxID=1121316 RepID=A0A1M5X4Z0_9CLOT|nr:Maf-like protein [Clostridium grantii]SHH94283.1 septum formation protein [Clostridium grantii DSM 8605]
MNIVLASASERRRELLSRLTENFTVIVSDFDESSVEFTGELENFVMEIAKGKALDVLDKLEQQAIIIGCDTIVAIDDKLLGKPKSKEEAINMLKSLSGKVHQVCSGIAIIDSFTGKISTDFVTTHIKFSQISEANIIKYVDTGDPMDKAGAYGIQGIAGIFVEEIKGCYYSVVGLPINKLNSMLKGMGVNL